jgi:hypothetical protein
MQETLRTGAFTTQILKESESGNQVGIIDQRAIHMELTAGGHP